MNGSLALIGSGEYLPAMAAFEKSLLDDAIAHGKAPTYIQIPTAAGKESADRIDYWKKLGQSQAQRIGVNSIHLPIYTREDAYKQEHVDAINNSALMYMSGGDPHHLATTLIDTPVWSAIVSNWQSGASLAGCSAGAMVLSSQIPNFRFTKNPPTQGLNLLPNVRVIPHFNKFFRWIPESAAKVLILTEKVRTGCAKFLPCSAESITLSSYKAFSASLNWPSLFSFSGGHFQPRKIPLLNNSVGNLKNLCANYAGNRKELINGTCCSYWRLSWTWP